MYTHKKEADTNTAAGRASAGATAPMAVNNPNQTSGYKSSSPKSQGLYSSGEIRGVDTQVHHADIPNPVNAGGSHSTNMNKPSDWHDNTGVHSGGLHDPARGLNAGVHSGGMNDQARGLNDPARPGWQGTPMQHTVGDQDHLKDKNKNIDSHMKPEEDKSVKEKTKEFFEDSAENVKAAANTVGEKAKEAGLKMQHGFEKAGEKIKETFSGHKDKDKPVEGTGLGHQEGTLGHQQGTLGHQQGTLGHQEGTFAQPRPLNQQQGINRPTY